MLVEEARNQGVFVCLFACVFVWLFVCLFVCVFVCLLGAGAGAGALFGSFWGPGVVIWIPFWVIWGPFWVSISGLICSLYVVICVFFEDFGYGKTSKSRRIASTNGGSLSILPPSVLAIRGDLLVFPYPKSTKNTQITT
jgi:hypothetical protein